MPIWLAGPAAAGVSRTHGLTRVCEDDAGTAGTAWSALAGALGPVSRRLSRPGLWGLDADATGDFDVDALVARLRAHQRAWGLDAAVLRLPRELDDAARARIAHRLATAVKPRVIMNELPAGLEQHWRDTQIRKDDWLT